MSERVVLIVGAGGTLSDAEDSFGGPRQYKPPLDRGFFSVADKIDPENCRTIRTYMDDQYSLEIIGDDDSLEGVLCILYVDSFRSDNIGDETYRMFRVLLELLIKVLAATTNSLVPTTHDATYRILGRLLDDGIRPEDITIITFNYDLHIERDLDLLSKDRSDTRIFAFPHCYRLIHNNITAPKGDGKNCFQSANTTEGITLLKLHGSLNWYSRHLKNLVSKPAILSQQKSFFITRRKIIQPFMKKKAGNISFDSFPVIIPPVFHKAGVLPEFIKPLWQAAEEVIRDAHEIIVFGYSCPSSDHESANMIRRAFRGGPGGERLHIIDPNPNVLIRYVTLTGAPAVSYYRRAYDFLEIWRTKNRIGAS